MGKNDEHGKYIQNAPTGLNEIDFIHQKILSVNKVVCKSTGYTEEELLQKNIGEMLTRKSALKFQERVQRILAGKSAPLNIELEIRKKNKETFWAFLNMRLTHDDKGQIKGATVAGYDITKRKQLEDSLLQSKKMWEETFDAIPDWVSILDSEFCIIRSNISVQYFSGTSLDQVIGKPCFEIFHGTDCPYKHCPVKRAFESRQMETMEFQHKDGRWLRSSVHPIISTSHEPHVVHVVRDITDVKEREKETVFARKNEAFHLLAGGLAHDYNNILSVIWGNISLLKEDVADSSLIQYLEEAEKACEQAKILTHKFLTLSQKGYIQKSVFDLCCMLRAVLEEVPETRKIQYSLNLCQEPLTVEMDQKQMETVFRNIILNAVESMPLGGNLDIALNQIPCSGVDCPSESSIEIKFSDTGKGIAPSDVQKVFDPYFSSKGLGTQKGRGLGLSVVKALVENHGGSIAIKSRLNKGTQVIIYLPSCAMKRRLVREQFDSLSPEKPIVLIMDDDPAVRTLCQRLLERLGYAVIATGNSLEAQFSYEYACQHHVQIDLVLFDQNIKNSSGGVETLNILHQSGFNGKSVIVTGSPSSPVISDYKFYGFDARVLKPFSIKEFEKVIASVMTE